MFEIAPPEKAAAQTSPVAVQVQPRHIDALDGIRGIAILMVCVFHFTRGLTGGVADQVLSFGLYGVDLFFTLSGFLITGILLDSLTARNFFSVFYARRTLRIAPLYFAFLALVFAALLASHHPRPDGSPWWYVLYFANWKPNHTHGDPFVSHLWSLSIEEQFYLAWPLIVLVAKARRLPAVCLTLALAALCLRCILPDAGVGYEAIYRGTFTRLDGLVLGALAAAVIRNEAWTARLRPASFALMLAAFAPVAVAVAGDRSTVFAGNLGTWGASALAAGFAIWIFRASFGPHPVLSSGWLTNIGKRAYGIYLIHAPIAEVANPRFLKLSPGAGAIVAYVLAMFALSYALAWLSFRFFETPINRRKSKFRYA